MIDSLACGNEEKDAISWFNRRGEEHGVNYGRFYSDVLGLKESLLSKGLAGKHIAILGENSYEWLIVYFAATYIGSIVVCIDVEQSDETINQMLKMADVDAMFAAPQFADICHKRALDGQYVFMLTGSGDN
jgi:long-chain acyl-CoA synthetase